MNLINFYKRKISEISREKISEYFLKISNTDAFVYVQKDLYNTLKEFLPFEKLNAHIIYIDDIDYDDTNIVDKHVYVLIDSFFYKTKLYKYLNEKYKNQITPIYQELYLDIGFLDVNESIKLWNNISKLIPYVDDKKIEDIIKSDYNSYIELFKNLLYLSGIVSKKTLYSFIYADIYTDTFGSLMQKIPNVIIFTLDNRDEINYFYGLKYLEFFDFIDVFIGTFVKELPKTSKYINIHHGIIDDPAIAKHFEHVYYFVQREMALTDINIVSSNLLETTNQVSLGYPKLDKFIKYFNNHSEQNSDIMIATSNIIWNFEKLSPVIQDSDFIPYLLEKFKQNRIVFRPHPSITTNEYIVKYVDKLKQYNNFHFDDEKSYLQKFSQAKVFIADALSSSAYTYAFATLRPVIFYIPKYKEYIDDYKNKKYTLYLEVIGDVATTKEQLSKLVKKYKNNVAYIKQKSQQIKKLRDENILNIGSSEDKIIEFIDNYIKYDSSNQLMKYYANKLITLSKMKLTNFFDSFLDKKIAIYGAGEHYSTVLKKLYDFSKLNIVAFSDSNKDLVSQKIDAIEIINKDNLEDVDAIIISSKKYELEIFKDLSQKYKNIYTLYEDYSFDIMMILEQEKSKVWANINKIEYFLDNESIEEIINADFKTYKKLFNGCLSKIDNKNLNYINDLKSFYFEESTYLKI